MKKLLMVLVAFVFLTSCLTEKELAKKSMPTDSKIYQNTEDKHDFISVGDNGVTRFETGGVFSSKIKKRYTYQEVK